ncbi:unnamed protein product [Paramecium octaurelia]|uniref:Uncharacterized protein n=1 Tax=Paramecium octaurelia TaxID=43137 RepID=A0A8S1SRP9_PAROT|nr:unnamed protein product [Paramecium octaurelia]
MAKNNYLAKLGKIYFNKVLSYNLQSSINKQVMAYYGQEAKAQKMLYSLWDFMRSSYTRKQAKQISQRLESIRILF